MCGNTTVKVKSSTPNIDQKTGKKTYSYHLQKQPLIDTSDINLIFPEEEDNDIDVQNKFAIALCQDTRPSLITYDFFYRMTEVLKLEKTDLNVQLNEPINFMRDYFVNLFKIDIQPPKEKDIDFDKATAEDEEESLRILKESEETNYKKDIFKKYDSEHNNNVNDLVELIRREKVRVEND